MTGARIAEILGDARDESGRREVAHPAFAAFCEEMSDKDYGHDETWDAWFFFRDGYTAARKQTRYDLMIALGYSPHTETAFLGTWEELIRIAKKNREQLAMVREACR